MLKKILSYGSVEGVAKGLNKLTVLLLPFFLDSVSFGKIGLILALELLLPFISLLGLERAVLRFYSERDSLPNFSKTISLSVTFTHGIIAVLFLNVYLLGVKSIWGLDIFPDIISIVLLVYLTGINRITLNKFRVDGNHKKYYQGRLYIQISKFALVLLFVFLTKNHTGYLIGSIISALSANILFKIKTPDRQIKEVFDKKTFITLTAFSWPFIFHGIATNLLGNADRFILGHFMSLENVGLYTLVYAIGSSMLFVYIGISVYLEPIVYKEKRDEYRERLLSKYLIISLLCGLGMFIVISLLSKYVLPHFYSEFYTEAFSYIPFIAISFLMFPFYLKSSYKMIYEKRTLLIALLSVANSVFNIGLNIYLIPTYGIYAAVITTLLSFILQAVLFCCVANKNRIDKKELLYILLFGIILSANVFLQLNLLVSVVLICFLILFIYLSFRKTINFSRIWES